MEDLAVSRKLRLAAEAMGPVNGGAILCHPVRDRGESIRGYQVVRYNLVEVGKTVGKGRGFRAL